MQSQSHFPLPSCGPPCNPPCTRPCRHRRGCLPPLLTVAYWLNPHASTWTGSIAAAGHCDSTKPCAEPATVFRTSTSRPLHWRRLWFVVLLLRVPERVAERLRALARDEPVRAAVPVGRAVGRVEVERVEEEEPRVVERRVAAEPPSVGPVMPMHTPKILDAVAGRAGRAAGRVRRDALDRVVDPGEERRRAVVRGHVARLEERDSFAAVPREVRDEARDAAADRLVREVGASVQPAIVTTRFVLAFTVVKLVLCV